MAKRGRLFINFKCPSDCDPLVGLVPLRDCGCSAATEWSEVNPYNSVCRVHAGEAGVYTTGGIGKHDPRMGF
jgi:hypothetical protein